MLGEKRCEAKGRVTMQDALEHKEEHIRAVKLFKYALQQSEVNEIKLLHNVIIMNYFSTFLCAWVFLAFLLLYLRKIFFFSGDFFLGHKKSSSLKIPWLSVFLHS